MEEVLDFDKVEKKVVYGYKYTYGFIWGNEKIVFIKPGAGGSHNGYKNKYLKMARLVHERLGATVICSSHEEESLPVDERMINSCVKKLGFSDYELYFVGHSDGANHNLLLAERFEQRKKMLAINPSFVTFDDFLGNFNKLGFIENVFVCGSKDKESCDFVEKLIANGARIRELEIEGADHNFTNMLDEYIDLICFL